jgi:anti-sigma factor RsiW
MTCNEVSEQIGAFLDAELPGPQLLNIARHAGTCSVCDDAIRSLTALREAIERSTRTALDGLDLTRVWPAVELSALREDRRRAWRRRLRTAPAWGVAAAMAAGALLWLRTGTPEQTRVAARPRPNQAVIERLDTAGHFELRRERKNGTTLIMVSDTDDGTPP